MSMDKGAGTQTIKASEFKARCLKLMDEVANSGEEIVITKNGKPVAKVGAVPGRESESWFGRDRGKIRILGDVISPVEMEWEAESKF